jgi:hypothetical protein
LEDGDENAKCDKPNQFPQAGSGKRLDDEQPERIPDHPAAGVVQDPILRTGHVAAQHQPLRQAEQDPRKDRHKHPGNPQVQRFNDQRQRLVLSGLWALPYWQGTDGWRRYVLDGWSFSWIATYATGQPYSDAITNDVNRASSAFRSVHMVRVLSQAVRDGQRVIAVVGGNHVPLQEAALRCEIAR